MRLRRQRLGTDQREREVDDCLLRWGLVHGPHRLSAATGGASEPAHVRFRQALAELGGVFAAFGAYLATRPDVLLPRQCLDLAAIEGDDEPLAFEAGEEFIARETGQDPQEVFASIDPVPTSHDFAVQTHTARTADGRAVTLEFVRPDGAAELEKESRALDRLAPAWPEVVGPEVAFQPVAAEFRRSLAARCDMAARSGAMIALKQDLEAVDQIAIPESDARLCTPRLLVTEHIAATSLGAAARGSADALGPAERQALARRVSRAWLHLALVARQFPITSSLDDLDLLPDGRLALRRAVFAGLPARSQSNLWSYLQATAADDSAGAGSWLLDELGSFDSAPDIEQFRTRIRQLVPFRDGGWSTHGETLAEHLFLHWRLARVCGYRLPHALLAFSQGIFSVAKAARDLAGENDALREGLEDLRWQAGWGQLRQLANVGELGGILRRNSMDLIELPTKLDQALTAAARPAAPPPAAPAAQGLLAGGAVSLRGVALMSLMAVIALFWSDLEALAWLGAWTERVLFGGFLILGALLLTTRAGRR